MAHDGLPPASPTAPVPLACDRARALSDLRANRSTRYVPDASSLASPYRLARRLAQVAVPGLFLSLAACGGNMEEPTIRLNPNPTSIYDLKAKIAGAPGPFDSVSAFADYAVTNPSCGYIQAVSGARIEPSKRLPITLAKDADGSYTGRFVVDQLIDEDYYEKGVCHWTLAGVSFVADHGKSSFQSTIWGNDLTSNPSSMDYFAADSYHRTNPAGRDLGTKNRDRMLKPDEAFSIRMEAVKVTP